ncbi:PREDICTED: SEC12-like protein 2 [Theobroma cacao]|uniref:SEC12-like protein 2 n=1 Tax=Theobroma cacao TaxID=3641 RepID=A0AB32VKA9_THECC|nr:PREDICTED: SEC12-like protein 2 [Theobroma cacao]
MTNSNSSDTSSDLQKYGVPFYGAGWVPYDHIRSKLASQEKNEENEDKEPTQSKDDEISTSQNYVVFSGGGGEGRSGIPNAIVVSHVDFASNSLSEQPVFKLGTDSDLPYRMTVHPRGDGIICALQQSCRLFEWEEPQDNEVQNLGVKVSEKVLTQLEDVGQQLALRFNSEGSILAVGGEDGSLRVFKWPSMEIILNEAQAHSSVKDLDFSCDGKFLVSLGSGLCRIWDVESSKVVASLAKGNDEVFAFCRFSQINDKDPVLYIAAVTDHGGSVLTWNTTTWKRMRSNRVVREAISAFNVSADGKFLAVGTVGGDLFIINSSNMRAQMMVKKAHLGLVTALTFSHDSRALISASLDSSARVTLIKDKTKTGGMSWMIIFIVLLLAIAVYFMKEKGIIP